LGWYVIVTHPDGLNLSADPGFSGSHIQIAVADSRLCVIGGPQRADTLWWWQFRTDQGTVGWGIGDYVEKLRDKCVSTPTPNSTPTPTATPTSTRRPAARPTQGQSPAAPASLPTPLGVLTPTATPIPINDIGVHVIRLGDTLFCIARAYGVSPWAIATRNRLVSFNVLYPGRSLIIPDVRWENWPAGPVCARQFELSPTPTATPGSGTVQPQVTITPTLTATPSASCRLSYTVRAGDTLWSIARTHGVSPWDIVRLNSIANPNLIFVGDVLCIP
jgi:LysM repeat protein